MHFVKDEDFYDIEKSPFINVYRPLILWFGRIYGLNLYVGNESSRQRQTKLKHFLILYRCIVILLSLYTMTNVIFTIIQYKNTFGLNASTVTLIQTSGVYLLGFFNQILLCYLNGSYVGLIKLIDEINPYNNNYEIVGKKWAERISFMLALNFILNFFIQSAFYIFVSLDMIQYPISRHVVFKCMVPFNIIYDFAASVYPMFQFLIILIIVCCIVKTFNRKIKNLPQSFQTDDEYNKLQLKLAKMQKHYHQIVRIIDNINDEFSFMCSILFAFSIFMLCVTLSILWKSSEITTLDILVNLHTVASMNVVLIIIIAPALIIHSEVSC